MRKLAIRQALQDYAEAAAAHAALTSDAEIAHRERAWEDFLLAATRVFNKLYAGCNGHGPSIAWAGRVKNLRRTDELLSYMQHARDVREHGVQRMAERHDAELIVDGDGGFISGSTTTGKFTLETPAGKRNKVTVIPARLTLVPVVDTRHGVTYPVPNAHLGVNLSDPTPETASRLTLAFLMRTIDEARALPVS